MDASWTGAWGRFRAWRRRRSDVLAAEQGRALDREAARAREAFAVSGDAPRETPVTRGIAVRWGLPEDEEGIADLLGANGVPRWVAFEERFVVAEERGRTAAAVRYRTEPGRLLLGLLVAGPRRRDERRLAVALYAGAGALARELGAREVLAGPRSDRDRRADHLREAGYAWGVGGWRLDPARPTTPKAGGPGEGG